MASTVLSREEMESWTGYKQAARQATWLKANGIKFRLSRQLHPKVDRGHYESKMGAGRAADTTGPNWSAMKGAL